MTLVEIRCKFRGCGALLCEVTAESEVLAGFLLVPACLRHDKTGGMAKRWQRRLPWTADDLTWPVPWADLLPALELAQATEPEWLAGHPVVHTV